MKRSFCIATIFSLFILSLNAQTLHNPGSNHGNSFEELDYLLATPNEYRTASGAPGPKYWQQRADYNIAVEVDEASNMLYGKETITYYNQSPNQLTYLWVQIDENFHHPDVDANRDNTGNIKNHETANSLAALAPASLLEGYGVNLTAVTDAAGNKLHYLVNQTMMRIDLPEPLQPAQQLEFNIAWNYKINNKQTREGRGGYETFASDSNNLYSITQFYPRMAVYSDFKGWQTLPFTGGAEFALTFGNFKVAITVPADHIVAATGECRNYEKMLTPAQLSRWKKAQTATTPIEVVSLSEALAASKQKSTAKKTWIYEAVNVRDFAFNTSRRLVWDAMAVNVGGKNVMCMSYYGKEAYPLYSRYSTRVVAHTIKNYSKRTINYPYPVAISVEAANGMEYPMLAMNWGRAEADGTYSEALKNSTIMVIIHEVGHNFFPMIVNSDERQYWWMDEGLNTFMQYLTEQEFDPDYPSGDGPSTTVLDYMRLPKEKLEPIMTKGDYVMNVGANAYSKAAAGLNILRETIMGRELFDFAFKEYARRWAFKHPTPADFFRTMEDASAVDLDWFWRGWFYGTDPVDIAIDSVKYFRIDSGDKLPPTLFEPIANIKNKQDKSITYAVDKDTTLRDFYYYNRGADAALQAERRFNATASSIDSAGVQQWAARHLYELTFSNRGGLVMPIILQWTYKDGTTEIQRIPVGIWKLNERQVSKVFIKDKEVASVILDPLKETADINEANGMWPVKEMPTKFQLFKQTAGSARGQSNGGNAMQQAAQKQKTD